jgi:PKD repeat protein
VAHQLLAFFKTDPTTTPWFLRSTTIGQPPQCTTAASSTNGAMPLTVGFTANATVTNGAIREYLWTFEDGDFSTQPNPTKVFPAPGTYRARLTVTDTNGNTAMGSVAVNVTTTFDLWRPAKFTATELANPAISGPQADPDQDGVNNLFEYAFGLEPKVADANAMPTGAISNGYFTFTYTQYKAAADLSFVVETSDDLVAWHSGPAYFVTAQTIDNGPTETITARGVSPISSTAQSFARLKVLWGP